MQRSTLLALVFLVGLAGSWGRVDATAQSVHALDPSKTLAQYLVDAWTTDDGLPQNSVSAILQSRDGYIWLGTQEGLVRFDGTRFQVFDRRSGVLPNNNVVALHEDASGNLWIGTLGGGLVHHADGQFTAYTKADGLASNSITALLEDATGDLWIGTADAGLSRLSGEDIVHFGADDGLPAGSISALHDDGQGGLWIGTLGGGLVRYHDGAFTTYRRKDGLPSDDVTSLQASRDGSLWVGTRNGLARRRDGRFASYGKTDGLLSELVLSLREDAAGTLWVGTDHGGLSRFRGGRFETLTMKEGLAYDVVRALYTDRDGSLWVGTDGGGLNRLRSGPFTNYTTADGLAHNFAYALYEDAGGALWIGTDGGLSRYKDGRFASYTTAHGLSNNFVLSIYGSRDGSLWIGTYGAGLNRLEDGRFTAFTTRDGLPGDEIYALFEDSRGTLWIGTRQGLSRYANGRFTTLTTRDGLSSNDITALAEDAQGRLWVGTYNGGINVLDGDTVVRRYTRQDGLLSDYVMTMYADAEGTMWIGTREGGLNRFRFNQFAAITLEHGLYNDNVFQIVEDERGNLWMSCNQGLFRVSKEEIDDFVAGRVPRITSVVYGRHDGLPSTEFNGGFQPAGWRTRDGRLWFPTNRGIVAVDPGPITDPAPTAPVLIERITADAQPVDLHTEIALPAGTNRIEIDFVAPTFLAADRLQYRYRLEGVDADWVYAGTRREAFYTNLAPGTYTFLVTAGTADGGWAETPSTITFALEPFFYETPLFMLLCALAFGCIGFGAYRLRVRHLRSRQKELLQLVEMHTRSLREAKERTEKALLETEEARREAEQQKEIAQDARTVIEEQATRLRELDRLKTRFFSNISHEFRTPLTLTIGPLENALTGVYGPVHPQMRKQLELMLRNARRLLRLINQLLDLAKLDSGRMELNVRRSNLLPLLEGVVLSFTAFADEKQLQLEFTCDHEEVMLDFDPEGLEKVFFNLLSNAVKFTPAQGRIQVTVEEKRARLDGRPQQVVEVRVKDTGIGIPSDELPYIFDRFHQVDAAVTHTGEGTGIGLSLVKELVALHGGTIQAASEPGSGTEFVVRLPRSTPHTQSSRTGPVREQVTPGITRGPLVEMAVFDDGVAERHATGDGAGEVEPLPVEIGDGFDHALDLPHADVPPSERPLILVVDDNPDVRAYVASCLEAWYRIATAGDGREALARARELAPDLVISDVMMPHLDGYGLCRALRADDRLQFVPVILLTARAGQDDRLEGLDAGSTDYIAKPFNTNELLARVRNLLALRQQQKALESLNAELEQKNHALHEASEMKTQLLHIAAHDMKNPLNAIREFARLLKNEVGRDSRVFDPLDLIHKSSDQMLHLVTSLLDSAAIESGQIVLQMEPVNLNTLAAAIVRRNQPLADQKGQQLILSISEERCLVQADKERILEAMDNLVNNAVKYSPLHKTIRVNVERQASHVRFEVCDEGPGLTEEDRRKLFGKFQRLSAQPTGGETSTGLGLAIVKQLTELHDGRVIVESEPGKGSTFALELPILTDAGVLAESI